MSDPHAQLDPALQEQLVAYLDGELDGEQSRARLLKAMDELNNKYGMSTLAPATMLTAFKAAPTRIAFHSIPDLF